MENKVIVVDNDVLNYTLTRIGNQIFKLLPTREEGLDWVKPLETLFLELAGLQNYIENKEVYFSLCCKLRGLLAEADSVSFELFRRSVFECCSLIDALKVEEMGADDVE